MGLTDIIFNTSSAFIMMFILYFFCDRKYTLKVYLYSLPILILGYELLDLSMVCYNGKFSFFSGILELMLMFGSIVLLTEGGKWLNYVKSIFGFAVINAGWTVFLVVFPYLGAIFSRIVVRKEENLGNAILVTISYTLFAFIMCLVFSVILKRRRLHVIRLTDKDYKLICIIYIIIAYSTYLYKVLYQNKETFQEKGNLMITVGSFLLSATIFSVVWVKIYERALLKENEKYLKSRENINGYYRQLVENNIELKQVKEEYYGNMYSVEKLGIKQYRDYANELKAKLKETNNIPLSGILNLDVTLSDYNRKAQSEGIIMECSIAPLVADEICQENVIGAISSILERAIKSASNARNARWINLAIRNKGKMLAINVEFSKKVTEIVAREDYEFNYIRKLVAEVSGAFIIKSKRDKVQLGVLIP